MTVAKAVKGLKNVIRHREEFINGLDELAKDWKDEGAIGMIDAVKDFMTKALLIFFWVLV